MQIVVIGTGYVGLVSGLGYAKLGHRVACVDTDAAKVALLDRGEAPFYEPGILELLREMQGAGRVLFTTDASAVLSDADVILFAVGTPALPSGEADLSSLFSAADTVGRFLAHEAVLVTKSTVPVGTNRAVLACVRAAMAASGNADAAARVQAASLPEFLREGSALADFLAPDRIVIGADVSVVHALIGRMHEGIAAPRLEMSIESAELTKYAANAFLATKISFINEIANVAERTGADVRDIAAAIGADPRIGPYFLNAGIGYGGSCFPKDVCALRQLAGVNGYEFKLISAAIEVNNRQRERFFERAEAALGSLRGRTIAVWGLTFKGGTDDIRESAAVDLVRRLYAAGAEVTAYDPLGMEAAKAILPPHLRFAPTAVDAAAGAEALFVLTDWKEFRDVSFATVHERMLEPRIFDGKNLLADMDLGSQGFEYYGVGFTE